MTKKFTRLHDAMAEGGDHRRLVDSDGSAKVN
jgi:hypothetical protein